PLKCFSLTHPTKLQLFPSTLLLFLLLLLLPLLHSTMPTSNPISLHTFITILLLLHSTQTSLCHTKGLRQRKPAKPHSNRLPQVNLTRTHFSEQQFMKWVNFVGSLKHSVFRVAKNKIFPSFTLTVDKNPLVGDFTSIQDAVDSLPFVNLLRVLIKVHAGVYTEKVSIPPLKSFITLQGSGAHKTIVQWGDTAQTPGPKGQPMGTYASATFAVNSPFFIARNITFKNTTPVPAPGSAGKQAVAFRISADNAAFIGCRFLGAQDTLYDQLGRHYYKDCYIEGSVDFIFGNGLSLFEGCEVHAIAQRAGAVTAQGRNSMLQDTGFSFVNCKVTGSGVLYLGRAWGPFSRVVFAYTYMDNIILPKGWYNCIDSGKCRTVYYGQYKCTGPGASFAGRVAWSRELTDEEAQPFLSLSFIDGSEWIKL
ncbi:Probable pectinesterase 53, partial [Linum perenne]